MSTAERTEVQFDCWETEMFGLVETFRTNVEDEAIEWAKAHVTEVVPVVWIEASSERADTFALRTVHHDGFDAGWSCWIDGGRSATKSLDVCFARDRPAVAS